MKLKDLIGISLVSIFLFPVVLIGIMMAAGVVHLEFGESKDRDKVQEVFAVRDQAKQEEMESKQLKAYKAVEAKEQELKTRQDALNREMERLESLKLETEKARDEIRLSQKRIEELVGRNSELQDKQIASLAEVYGGMRPEEAAPILLSLDDGMVVRIMRKIPETRATSKLMAALAALDVKRAARITKILGGRAAGKTRPEAAPAKPGDSTQGAPPAAPENKKHEPQKKA